MELKAIDIVVADSINDLFSDIIEEKTNYKFVQHCGNDPSRIGIK